jgi:hypothetical protein
MKTHERKTEVNSKMYGYLKGAKNVKKGCEE